MDCGPTTLLAMKGGSLPEGALWHIFMATFGGLRSSSSVIYRESRTTIVYRWPPVQEVGEQPPCGGDFHPALSILQPDGPNHLESMCSLFVFPIRFRRYHSV
jgi:hypothetical protein